MVKTIFVQRNNFFVELVPSWYYILVHMHIIKTDVVGAGFDVFWEEAIPGEHEAVQKPVLVIVADCAENTAGDGQLQKMLEACKLTSQQYYILRISDGQKISWYRVREKINPKIVFLIGVLPVQLGIAALFRLNEANNFNDRLWLPTVSLQELDKNQELKKQLWTNGMKPLFIDRPV